MNNINEYVVEKFSKISDLKYRPRIRFWIPEGMVDEECLRKDVQDIYERGFGGIEVVSENFLRHEVSEYYKWNSNYWIKMIDVILDEAGKYGLTVDISNGLQWPISVPNISDSDNRSTLYELTYGVTKIKDPNFQEIDLPKRRKIRSEGTPKLIAVQAYKIVSEGVLEFNTYIDLKDYVKDEKIFYDFSKLDEEWSIFAFWSQPATQKVAGQYYVIDHLNDYGANACIEYWRDSFFSRISEKNKNQIESIFCDSLEYNVTMEWTRDFEKIFYDFKGYNIIPYLPAIGIEGTYPQNDISGFRFVEPHISEIVNNDYLNMISYLYCNNHLKPLTTMANLFGKKIRYQIAYNKPFCLETAACFVDIPENESLSRPSIDNLRTAAGAAHLTRKERYSYECTAEYKNSYGQTLEDIFWWIKRAYMAGVNSQVFHGASYSGEYKGENNESGYIKGTEWPGYEAFGKMVSNYWNRTLSKKAMKNLLDTIARINMIASKKQKVDLVFVREEYLNNGKGGDGNHLVNDNGVLNSYGYSYEFISPDMFDLPNVYVECNLLDPKGVCYKALIVDKKDRMSYKTLVNLKKFASLGLPIYFIGKFDYQPMYMEDLRNIKDNKQLFEELIEDKNVYQLSDYNELLNHLIEHNILPDAYYREPSQLLNLHCQDEKNDYYILYNYNKIIYDSKIRKFKEDTIYPLIDKVKYMNQSKVIGNFIGKGTPVLFDPVSGDVFRIPYNKSGDRYLIELTFYGDELKILGFLDDEKNQIEKLQFKELEINQEQKIAIKNWKIKMYEINENIQYPKNFEKSKMTFIKKFDNIDNLVWWHSFDKELELFAGCGIYEASVNLDDDFEKIYLNINEISDSFELFVNGYEVPCITQRGLFIDITKFSIKGSNNIIIKVYSNLFNKLNRIQKINYGINGNVSIIIK